MNKKIGFGDLTGWLKGAIIGLWILIILNIIAFMVGFISAI